MRNIHKGGLSSRTMRSPVDLLLLIRCKTIPPDQQIEGPYQAMQHPKRYRSCLSRPQAAHPHHHRPICRYHHSLFRLNKYNYVFLCQEPYHLNIPAPYLSGRAYFSLILMHPNHPIALLGQCMPAKLPLPASQDKVHFRPQCHIMYREGPPFMHSTKL